MWRSPFAAEIELRDVPRSMPTLSTGGSGVAAVCVVMATMPQAPESLALGRSDSAKLWMPASRASAID